MPEADSHKEHNFHEDVAATDEGIPMGVQLVGRPGGEATLLAIAAGLERRIGWQRRHPPVW